MLQMSWIRRGHACGLWELLRRVTRTSSGTVHVDQPAMVPLAVIGQKQQVRSYIAPHVISEGS